jgi:hypothetical protein
MTALCGCSGAREVVHAWLVRLRLRTHLRLAVCCSRCQLCWVMYGQGNDIVQVLLCGAVVGLSPVHKRGERGHPPGLL